MSLTPEHATYLKDHGVDIELAEALGVHSVLKVKDLPDEWRRGIGRHVPGIIFSWTSDDGRVSVQLRPDNPPNNKDGDPIKYVFQSETTPVLWAVRPAGPQTTKILIVEGFKQCLVAAKYAPPQYAVYGIAGAGAVGADGAPSVQRDPPDQPGSAGRLGLHGQRLAVLPGPLLEIAQPDAALPGVSAVGPAGRPPRVPGPARGT